MKRNTEVLSKKYFYLSSPDITKDKYFSDLKNLSIIIIYLDTLPRRYINESTISDINNFKVILGSSHL